MKRVKMNKISRLSFFFLVFFSLFGLDKVQATHHLGGEITWECNANGTYTFTITYYRACSGVNSYATADITYPGGTISMPTLSHSDVTPQCPSGNASRSCNGTQVNQSGDYGSLQQTIYRNTNVTLNGVPTAGTGWLFSYTSGARPQIENTNETNFSMRAIMYPYTPPGGINPLNTSSCYDNSPQFNQAANAVTCMGFKFVFNHLANDVELDSLNYGFVSPWSNPNTPIVFNTGYSAQFPLPDPSEDPSNGPITLDPVSGELTFEVHVADTGWYAQAIGIDAYRCGQKIATIVRDVPVYFINNCPVNPQAPSAEVDTAIFQHIERLNDIYTVNTFPDDSVIFQITSEDLIPNSLGIFPNITFEANGIQVPTSSANYATGTGCNGIAPCARFISNNIPADYVNPATNKVTFKWLPGCQHVGAGVCGSATSTYRFTLKMSDDGCPAPRSGLATLVVNIIAGDPTPLSWRCASTDSLGNVELSWNRTNDMPILIDTLEWNYYRIWGAPSPNGPWSVQDSIRDIDSLSTILTNQPVPSYYYIEKSTGPCDYISRPSDTINTISLSVTATPAASPTVANLSWVPYHWSFGGNYEVWAEVPANSGNWVQILDTNGTSASEVISGVCNDHVAFQVRAQDPVAGCTYESEVATARFVDNVNDEVVSIDSVTVIDSLVSISWNTPAPDIVDFVILYKDPVLGWVPVDTMSVNEPLPYSWQGSMSNDRIEPIRVIAVDSCGNEGDDQLATDFQAIFLTYDYDVCDNATTLNWTEYLEFASGGVAGYRVYADIYDANGTAFLLNDLVAVTAPTVLEYTHTDMLEGYAYNYRIQAFDSTGQFTSTSNRVGIETAEGVRSSLLYIAKVSNDENRNALTVQLHVDGSADADQYELQRATDLLGPYENIAVLNRPAAAPYVINFKDFTVARKDQDYYYRAVAKGCEDVDTTSNWARNILLTINGDDNVTNRLVWPRYRNFMGEVGSYEVYRSFQDSNSYELVGINPGYDTTFVDNVLDLVELNSQFCYYVKAIEANNPEGILEEGAPVEVLSPVECVTQSARLFTATAFRPNSNVAANTTFGPSIKLADLSNYQFYVLNRWGAKVFETNSLEDRWDGKNEDGELAPQGTYIYYVKFATVGGKVQEERGTFSLVR